MNLVDIGNKKVLAHMGFFDKNARGKYRENSKEVCAISSTKNYIDIIELDVRKSQDGVLYCYHGNFLTYHITLRFPSLIAHLKAKYKVDTLEDIVQVISEDKVIFLDIKDTNITREDILKIFSKKDFKEVILGNKSVSYLDRFVNMPNSFVKIMNGNILCNFYNLKKLKKKGYKYFEVVFPFQISRKKIKQVQSSDMEFRCSGLMFSSSEHYWNVIQKFNIKHVSGNFIEINYE